MKKHIFLGVLLMLTGFFFIPSKTFAFQHAYESKSDFIYALARNELPVYYSDYSNDLKTVLPKYTGVKVIGSSGSWYEIQYAEKNRLFQTVPISFLFMRRIPRILLLL